MIKTKFSSLLPRGDNQIMLIGDKMQPGRPVRVVLIQVYIDGQDTRLTVYLY